MDQTPTEMRRYPRFELSCTIKLFNETGQKLAETRTVNLSDGGALVPVPLEAVPAVGSVLDLEIQVPSSPAGAGPITNFIGQARVIRHQDSDEADKKGVALEFLQPLPLELDR